MAVQRSRLDEAYYLKNFISLLNFVDKQYGDILKKDEKLFIKKFKKFSKDAARLYVRLISRTGPLFRADKLNYSEIKNQKRGAIELAKAGFMVIDGDWELDDQLRLFTKPELVAFLKNCDSSVKSAWSRDQVIDELVLHYSSEFLSWVQEEFETYCPLGYETVSLFRLLFFGNLEQTLSDFILEDIGVLRYEKYRMTRKDRFFQNRKVIDETFKLIELQMELYFAREEGDEELVEELMKQVLKIKSGPLKRKREKLCRMAGQFFEKLKDYDQAVFYYKKSMLPPSRERLVRVLEKLDEDKKALNLCKKIQQNPIDDSEREFISHFPEKLKRKMGKNYQKQVREIFETQELKVPNPRGEKIEPWSLKHLERAGLKGFYVENHLWTSLYGLIFWDIIFKSKPGVFFNPFQRGPNDLYSEDFYLSRKNEIDKRLKWIGTVNWEEVVLETFDKKRMTANYLVRWKQINKSAIKRVLKRIPAEHIKAVMERMSESLRHNSSGFPDLFVYHPRKKDYCLLEVKGPGDQLQQGQKRWLRFFKEKNIPCKVLKVTY